MLESFTLSVCLGTGKGPAAGSHPGPFLTHQLGGCVAARVLPSRVPNSLPPCHLPGTLQPIFHKASNMIYTLHTSSSIISPLPLPLTGYVVGCGHGEPSSISKTHRDLSDLCAFGNKLCLDSPSPLLCQENSSLFFETPE